MSSDNTGRNWTARIALFAMLPALAGGLWLVGKAAGGTGPFTAAANSCNGFTVAAHQSADKGDTMVLSGTFAPGDRVHLAIDLDSANGYEWEATGALAKMVAPNGRGWFEVTKSSERAIWNVEMNSKTHIPPDFLFRSTSTVSGGKVRGAAGFARLETEIDVTSAGDGAITFYKTGNSAPSSPWPKLAAASCSASPPPTI